MIINIAVAGYFVARGQVIFCIRFGIAYIITVTVRYFAVIIPLRNRSAAGFVRELCKVIANIEGEFWENSGTSR